MKTAIIVYSITGNTKSVAQKLLESMKEKGVEVDLLQIKAKSDEPNQKEVELIESPDVKNYDRVILASPVHAFSLSKVMKVYLSQIDNLKSKEVIIFITHHFPYAWMGGNSALRQMRSKVESKDGLVIDKFSINWSSKKREQDIQSMIGKIIL